MAITPAIFVLLLICNCQHTFGQPTNKKCAYKLGCAAWPKKSKIVHWWLLIFLLTFLGNPNDSEQSDDGDSPFIVGGQ